MSMYLRLYRREVGKNILNVIFMFLSRSLQLPKPCQCTYKIGIVTLCVLGWYGPCEVLSVILDPLGMESGCGRGSRNITL